VTSYHTPAETHNNRRADTEHRAHQLILAAEELSKTATELRNQAEQLAADVEQLPNREPADVRSPLFTPKQAAAYLSVGLSTLYQIVSTDDLVPVRLSPKIIRYHQADLDQYIADRADRTRSVQPA
jgi:predicted DNA-binding transcriptional regulator AlpA